MSKCINTFYPILDATRAGYALFITNLLKKRKKKSNLDINNLRGQGYNDSNMHGKKFCKNEF